MKPHNTTCGAKLHLFVFVEENLRDLGTGNRQVNVGLLFRLGDLRHALIVVKEQWGIAQCVAARRQPSAIQPHHRRPNLRQGASPRS